MPDEAAMRTHSDQHCVYLALLRCFFLPGRATRNLIQVGLFHLIMAIFLDNVPAPVSEQTALSHVGHGLRDILPLASVRNGHCLVFADTSNCVVG